MVIGIGCDVVEHKITTELNWESDNNFLQRVFSPKELELYEIQKSTRFISGRFAAKEAVLKCLGTGMLDGISLTDIQILQIDGGQPTIVIEGEAKKISDQMRINLWHISITHSTSCSFAFIVAESRNP